MRNASLLKLAIAVAAVSGSAAQAMDAHSFYLKGSALKAQGAKAVLMPDFVVLKTEMDSALKAIGAENDRAKTKGQPLYCAPAKLDMSADQLLAEFRRIPTERRKKISVRQAFREIAIRRFPC